MRIGRQISHFDKVLASSIKADFSDEKPVAKYRYLLSMEYANPMHANPQRTKTATVILKNPSSADVKMSDKTITTAEQAIYIHFPDVKTLNILNLFAIRGTDAKDVASRLKTHGYDDIVGPKNNERFEETIATSDYIITAWGGNSGIDTKSYNRRIEEVQNMLDEHKKPIFRNPRKGSEKYPFHACFWGYEDGFNSLLRGKE